MPDAFLGLTKLTGLAKVPDIRNLLIMGVSAGIIRWTEILAIGIYTYEQTGSPFMVAIMAFLNAVPGTLFGVLVGAMGERYNKRNLLLLGYGILLLLVSVLAYLAINDNLMLWHVALGTFLSGVVGTTEFPLRRTLLGEISGLERAPTSLTCDVAIGTITMFVGPLLGGFLMHDYGLHAFYFVAMGLIGSALFFVWKVHITPERAPTKIVPFLISMRDGFIHARHNKPVLGVLLITIILNFFGFSFMSMLPVIGADKMGLGPIPVGILSSMLAVGSLIGLLFIAGYASPAYFMRWFVGGALALLVAITIFSVTPWYVMGLVVLLIGGLGGAGFGSMQATITFMATAPEIRSRIMGLLVVCIGFGPLGVLHTGAMAQWLGADIAIGVIALEGLAVTLLSMWLLPVLRRSGIEAHEHIHS
ncbi:MAG: MFS transporter [Proteobacteria bacterium]|jgi:MFS family permease|nr:MFS transporter [Pseudomonadota bacterium]